MHSRLLKFFVGLVALVAVLGFAGCGSSPSHHPTTHHQTAAGSVHPPGWGRPAPPSVQRPRLQSVPTGTMYDSISLAQFPSNPFALAGYTSGNWPTYLSIRSRWPNVHTISIAVNVSHHADCLDVEPGDAVPSQAPGWVRADQAAGFKKPCLYSSYFEFRDQVIPALNAAGIARSSVYEWDADYTGVAHIDLGFDATQYTDKALGRSLDASLVTLGFLSIAQPPYGVTPKPRTICWGKGSTTKSKLCQAVAKQANHAWTEYKAFYAGLVRHQRELKAVSPYPRYFQQNKKSINVPGYKGPAIGYLNGRISTETHWAGVNKAKHDALVKAYHG